MKIKNDFGLESDTTKGMMGKFFDKLSTLLMKSIQLYNDEVRLTYKDEERDMESFRVTNVNSNQE